MSVLSEWDIYEKLISSEILIYPFKLAKVRGGCLSLTASQYAYIFDAQKKLSTRVILNEDNNFKVPARTTVSFWTNESIWMNGKFCGSIHSKVKLVSQGIGHIGTRVNPNWRGILAISLHNTTDNDVFIKLNETIAYLRFHQFITESSYDNTDAEHSGKLGDVIPNGCPQHGDLYDWLFNNSKEPWRSGNKEKIKGALISDQESDYKIIEQQLGQRKDDQEQKHWLYPLTSKIRNFPQWNAMTWGQIIIALATVGNFFVAAAAYNIALQTQNNVTTTQQEKALSTPPHSQSGSSTLKKIK